MEHIVITNLKYDPKVYRGLRAKKRAEAIDAFLDILLISLTILTIIHLTYRINEYLLTPN